MKTKRRNILKYFLSLPAVALVYSKKSLSCSDSSLSYISRDDVYGSRLKNKITYLKKVYDIPVMEDTNDAIHLKIISTDNEHVIPIIVSIENLSPHESCSRVDIHVESMFKNRISEELNFYYKVATYNYLHNAIPYLSTRFKVMSKGNYFKVIVVATIKSHDKYYLIQSESSVLDLYRCKPYVPVNTKEKAFRNNECIEARGWSDGKWLKIQKTSYCRKLYKSLGWPHIR